MIRLALLLLLVPSLCFGEIQVGPGGVTFSDSSVQTTASTGDGKWLVVPSVTQASIQSTLDASNGDPVYIPAGTYTLSSGLNVVDAGQIISGAGRGQTILYASSGFTDNGAIEITASEVTIQDLTIEFYQPSSSGMVKSDLNGYNAVQASGSYAIYANAQERTRLLRLHLKKVFNGVDFRANCGGSFVRDVEITHFGYGIITTNSLDTMRFMGVHVDDFGDLTAYQQPLFDENLTTIGMYLGRSDHTAITASHFACGTGVYLYDDGVGPPQVYLSGCLFETGRGLNVQYGEAYLTNCAFEIDSNTGINANAIVNAKKIHASSCTFDNDDATSMIYQAGSSAVLTISGSYFYGQNNQVEIDIEGGVAVLTGNVFERDADYSSAFIDMADDAGLSLTGCRFIPAESTTQHGVNLTDPSDDHNISGNDFNGWNYDACTGNSECNGNIP